MISLILSVSIVASIWLVRYFLLQELEKKTGAYSVDLDYVKENAMVKNYAIKRYACRPAYDPSEDENKILSGETETYFD